ncbi:zinc finger BED domain-containing protein 5-like [Centruroides sculpturatus]|uniref:zinc finger BED domain-containing protein 5-like n=1 Tax=Centruroides sculpturatus TaxID=218467 RepID=UPI000C6DD782|nr:zinc finger BED domain-containing protein 5-like [Centruroides sculpturatus]XP_023220246.1 zinc finger BED domain-containing protein 5-like [Centruroides sculpturatus]
MDKWLKQETKKELTHNVERVQLANTSQDNSISDVNTGKVSKTEKNRKYCNEYIKYGFTYIGNENCPQPQCVVCGDVLSNGCMKPSLLLRHLRMKHPNYKNKEHNFFKRLEQNMSKSSLKPYIQSSDKNLENAVEASYRISYRIAKCGKNHTIAENLILPCIKDAVRCMLGEDQVPKMNNIPLSNNTISRRIHEMSDDVEMTTISRIKNSKFFAIQVDESTDVANFAILLVIARYLVDNEIEENLLLCHPLSERTRGEDIFNAIDSYVKEKGIDWSNCCGLCTDGAKSMSGIYSGLRSRVMKVAPNVNWSHCCIHRQNLASKSLPHKLKLVLDEAVQVVNFIKSRPTNARIFKVLCDDMMNLHSTLLLHTEVRWLSRGKVLTRLFELRHEVQVFFESNPFKLSSKFHDDKWLQALAYLSDIFLHINKLNLAFQDKTTIFTVSDKIESIIKKFDFWKLCIKNSQPEVFETLHSFLSENKLRLSPELNQQIVEHLQGLKSDFQKYFPKPDNTNYWILNPFEEEYFQVAKLSSKEKENLIEISTDSILKCQFKSKSLFNFWADINKEFELLSDKALQFLLPFTSTVLVERAFSSYLYIKNKYRNKLKAVPDLRLYLASVEPDIKKLCEKKQGQGSH